MHTDVGRQRLGITQLGQTLAGSRARHEADGPHGPASGDRGGAELRAAATPTGAVAAQRFGKYELLEKLGVGGMAEVFRARVRGPDGFEKVLALKRILPDLAADSAFISMLVSEAKLVSSLVHPNIVQTYELGQIDGQYYIAMEYVAGRDLLWLLNEAARRSEPLPQGHALFIIAEVARALDYAHSARSDTGKPLGVVHRDVSPSNVLISEYGSVKLMDFGVARLAKGGDDSGHGLVRGKLGYMSPEQAAGSSIDHRSDIFSLGVMLFEALTSKRLLVASTHDRTLRNVREARVEPRLRRHGELGPVLCNIIRRATAREPGARYQSGEELHDALLDYLFEARSRVSNRHLAEYVGRFERGPLAPDVEEPLPSSRGPSPPPRPEDLTGSSFRLKHEGSNPFGPVTYSNFKNLLKTGSVASSELVSVDGDEWRRVGTLSGLRDLCKTLVDETDVDATQRGPIEMTTLPRVLYKVAASKATGRLRFTSGSVVKQLFLHDGRLTHATSTLKRELLGPVMARRRMLESKDIARAAAWVRAEGGFFGDALLILDISRPDEVFQALQQQFRDRVGELFSWESGEWEFHQGLEPPPDVPWVGADAIQLIATGVREHFDGDRLDIVLARRLDHIVSRKPARAINHNNLKLNAQELRWLRHMDDGMSVRELLRHHASSPEDRVTLQRVILLLVVTEQARLQAWTGAGPHCPSSSGPGG